MAENHALEAMVERVRKEQTLYEAKASSRSSKAASLKKGGAYASYKVLPLACAGNSRDSFSNSSLGDDAPLCSSLSRTALVQLSCRGRLRALQGLVLRGTFDPQSRFRASWDMLLLLAVMYITILLPLQTGFEEDLGKATTDTLNHISAGLDVFFLLDIAVNFRTGTLVST